MDKQPGDKEDHRVVKYLALFLIVSISCVSSYSSRMLPVRKELRSGNSEGALETYLASNPDSTGKNRLLFLMETGNLLRLADRYSEAENYLLNADRLSDNLRGVDVGEQIESMLSSDEALTFRGADYEKVFINYCLAACFAAEGNLEDARVECRRLIDKLRIFNQDYEEDNRYSDDAFIRYMMGVMFEADGNLNDALVAYRHSLRVYDEDYSEYYDLQPPGQLASDLLRVSYLQGFDSLHDEYLRRWPAVEWENQGTGSGRGEIIVFLERRNIAARYEVSVSAYSEDRLYKLAVPAIRKPFISELRFSVFSDDGSSSFGFLAEDLNAIAEKNLEDHAGRNLVRAIARVTSKTLIAEAGEEIVEDLTGEENGCWSEGVGIFLSVLGAATEKADLRAWLTLPAEIYVARLPLPEGTHSISVSLNGRTVFTKRELTIEEYSTEILFLRTDM